MQILYIVKEGKVAKDNHEVPDTLNKGPLNQVPWSGFAGLVFALSAIIIVLLVFQKLPLDREGGLNVLLYTAPIAAFLTGTFFWWLLITRTKRITIQKGIWVGMLIGLLSHLFAWYFALLVFYVLTVRNVIGTQIHSLQQYLFIGMINSLTSIFIVGWITVPGGGLIGGIMAYLQGKKWTTEVSKGISRTRKRVLFILIIAIVLFLTTCIHSDGPYRGKVVELETGKPIEGAVIAADWLITIFAHIEILCDLRETVTDKNGEFELPRGWCINHPLAKMDKPYVVVFKPGFLGFPPLGANQEERRYYMPTWGNERYFEDRKSNNVIKLGRPKTIQEKQFTLQNAEWPFTHKEALAKLPTLLKLTNEENKNLGFNIRGSRKGGAK